MGGVSSQSSTVRNTVQAINESVLNVVATSKTRSSQDCSTVQNISISIKGNVKIDNLTTNQIAAVSCTFSAQSMIEMSQQIMTDVQNKIDQIIAQSSKSTQEFLSLSMNNQSSNMTNETYLRNTINQAITTSMENVCTQNLSLTQGQTVVIENTTQWPLTVNNVNLDQNLQVIAIGSCVMNSISDILSSNTLVNDLVQKMDQSTISEQTGISALFGPLLLILLIGGGAFLLFSGKGMQLLANPKKLLIFTGCVIVLYMAFAYKYSWSPFTKKEGYLSLKNILVKPFNKYNSTLDSINEISYGAF